MMQVLLHGLRRGSQFNSIASKNKSMRLNSNNPPLRFNNSTSTLFTPLFEKSRLIIPLTSLFSTSSIFQKSSKKQVKKGKSEEEEKIEREIEELSKRYRTEKDFKLPSAIGLLEENGVPSNFKPCCEDYQTAIIKEHTMCTKFHFYTNPDQEDTTLLHVVSALPASLKQEEIEGGNLYTVKVMGELLREAREKGNLSEVLEKEDINGRGVLQLACAEGSSEAVNILLSVGCNASSIDSSRSSPIIASLSNPDPTEQQEIMNLLIEKGANIHEIQYDESGVGRQFVHLAAAADILPEAMKTLIESGVNVNEKDTEGMTPIHYAAGHGSPLALALIDYGADVKMTDDQGRTPLHFAIDSSYLRQIMESEEEIENPIMLNLKVITCQFSFTSI
eukprot:TRINITY_DN1622_c0_g3_i2.p1 TRINITY_DN1622_c0_g3~~TRINITY_DN1622_c0_g3_i2.p1  ORF type:complete len:390 (-),score=78.60 TRINITY_DN1622_c0_g3_i2:40-1209(-)